MQVGTSEHLGMRIFLVYNELPAVISQVRPSEPEALKREEWMTELPPEMKPSGIGARKFRKTNFDPGDRSVWTDTPTDRVHKPQVHKSLFTCLSEIICVCYRLCLFTRMHLDFNTFFQKNRFCY